MKNKIVIVFLSILFSVFFPLSKVIAIDNQTSITNGLNYLRSQQTTDGQIQGFPGITSWASMAFSAANIDINNVATQSGQTLQTYLITNPPTLSSSATDWEREILAITAANLNPYDFNGLDYVANLKTYYNSDTNQIGNVNQVNDDVFGILALVASRESTQSAILTNSLLFLISHQNSDGGFSYSTTGTSDIDDSAASIMSLVSSKNQNVAIDGLNHAIENAKNYLLSHQNADGGFAYDPNPATSWDTSSNISSTSWVLMALNALGLSNDASVINAQNYLLSTQQPDGSFPYQPIYPPGDTFDTAFAVIALTGKFWPISTYSGSIPDNTPTSSVTLTLTPTPLPSPTPTLSPALLDTNSSPTATPIPTPTPTPNPTIIVVATPTPEIMLATKATITITPIKTADNVLGVKTEEIENKNKAINWQPILPFGFLALGTLSLGLHGLKLYRKKVGPEFR